MVRAPHGTLLDVPIPKAVSAARTLVPTEKSPDRGPRVWPPQCVPAGPCFRVTPSLGPQVEDCEERYQIHLKSVNGPIDVLLINKDPAAPAPITLPVPPPRDLFSVSRRAPASSEARLKPRPGRPTSQGPRPPGDGPPAEAASSRVEYQGDLS